MAVHSAVVLTRPRTRAFPFGLCLFVTACGGGAVPAVVDVAPVVENEVVPVVPATDVPDLETRLVDMARATRGPVATALPIKPLGVTWSPQPAEGNAFGIVLHQRPTGRAPTSISGDLAGHPVRFALVDGQWFGVAPVPIGVSGPQTILLRLTFEHGSASEQLVPIEVRSTEFASTNLSVDSRFSSPPPEVLERIRAERELVREMLQGVATDWRIDGSFESPRPLDVTSPFGQARMFNGELRSRHTGLDLRGRNGAPVQAAGRGRVAFAGSLYFAGNAVYVDHGLGVFTGYFHLSRILVEAGDMVSAGDLVGEVGATGRVTAAHLHWFLSVGGQSLDAGSLLGMELPN